MIDDWALVTNVNYTVSILYRISYSNRYPIIPSVAAVKELVSWENYDIPSDMDVTTRRTNVSSLNPVVKDYLVMNIFIDTEQSHFRILKQYSFWSFGWES